MSCKRVRATLEDRELAVEQTVVERKASRLGRDDALALARRSAHVYVAKGKKTVHFDMAADAPTDDQLLGHLLGRSGFLRAPALREGDRFIVGFNATMYDELFA